MSGDRPAPPEDALSAYVDGELDADGRRVVEEALAASAGLRDVLAEVAEARTLVRGLAWPSPPPGFWDRVAAAVAAHDDAGGAQPPAPVVGMAPRRARVGARTLLAAGAAAAVALVAGVALVPERPTGEVAPAVPAMVDAHATLASVDADPISRLAPIGIPMSTLP